MYTLKELIGIKKKLYVFFLFEDNFYVTGRKKYFRLLFKNLKLMEVLRPDFLCPHTE